MFGFGVKKCFLCNEKLNKNIIEKEGKKFCSEQHAKEFAESLKSVSNKVGEGCCGV